MSKMSTSGPGELASPRLNFRTRPDNAISGRTWPMGMNKILKEFCAIGTLWKWF